MLRYTVHGCPHVSESGGSPASGVRRTPHKGKGAETVGLGLGDADMIAVLRAIEARSDGRTDGRTDGPA